MHDLSREEPCDRELDYIGSGVHVGDHAADLSTGQAVGDSAQPEHDLVAVDGVDVEVDRHARAVGTGEPLPRRRSSGGPANQPLVLTEAEREGGVTGTARPTIPGEVGYLRSRQRRSTCPPASSAFGNPGM